MALLHSTRRWYAVFVLGMIAFTIHGSLVPYQFEPRSWEDAVTTFQRLMLERAMFESRSDALANVMLGVPLGFALLGLLFVDRAPNRVREVVTALVLLPGCGLFSAAIEFIQLYFPTRTCAGSDVLCQVVGASLGMTIWITSGRAITTALCDFWHGVGSPNRALLAYLALLAFIQVLPLDLNASPRAAAKKAWREVNYVPFGELIDAPRGEQWPHVAKCVKVFALHVPVGLLATQGSGRYRHDLSPQRCFVISMGLAFALEAIQLPIESRLPSATDVIMGGMGILAGWYFGLMQSPAFPGGNGFGYVICWLIGIAIIWGPLSFPPVIRNPPATFDWIPGLPLESGNPLFALEDMLTKLTIFGLIGVVIGACDTPLSNRSRYLIAGGFGLICSLGQEAMQIVFGTHTPSITDILLGGTGAWLGAVLTHKTRTAGSEPRG